MNKKKKKPSETILSIHMILMTILFCLFSTKLLSESNSGSAGEYSQHHHGSHHRHKHRHQHDKEHHISSNRRISQHQYEHYQEHQDIHLTATSSPSPQLPPTTTSISKPNSRQPSVTPLPNNNNATTSNSSSTGFTNAIYKNEQRKSVVSSSGGLHAKLSSMIDTSGQIGDLTANSNFYRHHHHQHRHHHRNHYHQHSQINPQSNSHHKRYSIANNKENGGSSGNTRGSGDVVGSGRLTPPELKKTKRVSSSPCYTNETESSEGRRSSTKPHHHHRHNHYNYHHMSSQLHHSGVLMMQERNLNSSSSSYNRTSMAPNRSAEYRDLSSRRLDEIRRLDNTRVASGMFRKSSNSNNSSPFQDLLGFVSR